MVLIQTSQNGLPLTPHRYPGWTKAFIAFIISMTIYALFSMPAYFTLKESVAMAKAAYKNADYSAAITGYLTLVQIRPHSKIARIGAAEALFARHHEGDATEGLFWLEGLTLTREEFARIEKVMPKEYQQYFESKNTKRMFNFILSRFTFPGALVHIIVQRIFADLAKVPVHEICYFQISQPACSGYLTVGPVKTVRSAFFIYMGPLLINTVLCALLTFPAYAQIYTLDDTADHLTYCLIFLGITIGIHAIPSNDSLACLMSTLFKKPTNKTSIKRPPNTVSFVFITVLTTCLKVINGLTFLGSHLWYALGVSQLLPYLCGFCQS